MLESIKALAGLNLNGRKYIIQKEQKTFEMNKILVSFDFGFLANHLLYISYRYDKWFLFFDNLIKKNFWMKPTVTGEI